MNELHLNLIEHGRSSPLCFKARRMVNFGYTGRNQAAVRAHIEELSREGVAAPASIPTAYPVPCLSLTTGHEIEVCGPHTSGEVEPVFLITAQQVYVTVGSDHTDRELERHSILYSKQVCPNIIADHVWKLADVAPYWDELVLQSFVRSEESGKEILYQQSPLAALLPPQDIFSLLQTRSADQNSDGWVAFGGTVPIIGGEFRYGSRFRGELIDPRQGIKLVCEYDIQLPVIGV